MLSFLVGATIDLLYAALGVRSSAPPLVALTGLLGVVIGEAAWPRVASPLTYP